MCPLSTVCPGHANLPASPSSTAGLARPDRHVSHTGPTFSRAPTVSSGATTTSPPLGRHVAQGTSLSLAQRAPLVGAAPAVTPGAGATTGPAARAATLAPRSPAGSLASQHSPATYGAEITRVAPLSLGRDCCADPSTRNGHNDLAAHVAAVRARLAPGVRAAPTAPIAQWPRLSRWSGAGPRVPTAPPGEVASQRRCSLTSPGRRVSPSRPDRFGSLASTGRAAQPRQAHAARSTQRHRRTQGATPATVRTDQAKPPSTPAGPPGSDQKVIIHLALESARCSADVPPCGR
jgi:hypothetical protein